MDNPSSSALLSGAEIAVGLIALQISLLVFAFVQRRLRDWRSVTPSLLRTGEGCGHRTEPTAEPRFILHYQ
jgi:hypothetical protein